MEAKSLIPSAQGHLYNGSYVGGNARVHFGDSIQNISLHFAGSGVQSSKGIPNNSDRTYIKPIGLCLSGAPYIGSELFIGRDVDMGTIHRMANLNRIPLEQQRIVLGGLGGVGKTQLAIAYAKTYRDSYDSVFWLNASSEATLKSSFQLMAERVFDISNDKTLTTDQVLTQIKRWLSDPNNTRWLLIFDNYDEPKTYDLASYYPYASHGTIIVTTRLPDHVSGHRLRIQPLENLDHGLEILETRSGRRVADDIYARLLVEKLDGLPLALVTAGSYLQKSTWSFEQYLHAYEKQWNISRRRPVQLHEYQDRNLYTTWDLSYQRLKQEDPDAAQMLQLLAYFDHQAIWFGLFQAGTREDLPEWLLAVCNDASEFDSLMQVLVAYCFLEVRSTTSTYSMHTCVSDWTLNALNYTVDPQSYWYAFDCVSNLVEENDWELLDIPSHAQLTPHAVKLTYSKFQDVAEEIPESRLEKADRVGQLLKAQIQFEPARLMYLRTLTRKEKILGANHRLVLNTIGNLGNLYREQGKLEEARKLYLRTLAGFEEAPQENQMGILNIANNLGLVYDDLGRLEEAQAMYLQALVGYEKILGPENILTLKTVNNLGSLYRNQDKLEDARKMYTRALIGCEKALGADHALTVSIVNNLGLLSDQQGKSKEAEDLLLRALTGCERALGPEHSSTGSVLENLGILYLNLNRLEEAEECLVRAVAVKEKAVGANHISTLKTVNNLGRVYHVQKDLEKAEMMYKRVLVEIRKILGPDHLSTLDTANNLGTLYSVQGKLEQAKDIYVQAFATCRTDRVETRYRDCIQNLAMILLMDIKKADGKQSANSSLACLIQHTDKWGRSNATVIDYLAKAFLSFKDYDNAQFAVVQSARTGNNSPLNIRCDGCESDITPAQGRHICCVCIDMDLCDVCVPKYVSNSISLPGCSEHEYFNTGGKVSELSKSSDGQIDMDTWMSELKQQYCSQG